MLILVQPIRRSKRGSAAHLIAALLAVALLAAMAGGCHQMIPLAPDYSGYATPLAPPLVQRLPGVGTSVGYLAPDFKLDNLNGREVRLSDYRGKLVMLNFWTYCSACKEELPYIQSVYEARESLVPGLVVLAVNVTQQPDQVKQFVSYYGYTFEFLLDTWATVASDYYIHEIPTTFFVDRNGIIQDIQVGTFSGPAVIRQKLTVLAMR